MEGGEGLHPHQVVEHHGGVGVVRPIVELRHRPASSSHNIKQIKAYLFKQWYSLETGASCLERGAS